MSAPFGQTADEQGWNTDSMLGVMSDFIAQRGLMEDLDEYAAERAAEENSAAEDWVPPTAQEVAEAYEWADSIIAKIENDESVDSRLCEEAGEHQLTTRHTRAECPMTNEEENS